MLKTAVIGKTINGATQITRIMAISGDKIILVDATTGQSPKKVITKIVDKDLHVFADGATEPSVIVSDYALYDQTIQISGLGSGGEYVNYGVTTTDTMELGAISAVPATSSAPFMSTSAWWGVGILAVAGGVAAAAGGGGSSGSSTPVTATTHTASLVDSVVSGVSYTTSSGLSGVTDVNGSFSYKAGDIVTFKVGNATIGTFNTSNMNSDGIVMPQDIVGVARTDTTNTAVVNIAQFLQSLDSNNNPADGIVINSTTASSIGTVSVQTATDTEFTTAGVTTLVAGATATNNLNLVVNDTTHPTAAITLSDTVLNSGETATVTIIFSEAVVGFSNADVTVANGTLSILSSLDNITWTATLTPTANITSTANSISIANTYSDVAGNMGTTATSANYTVSTTIAPPPPPSLIITDDENAVGNIAGGTITYTFTFSDSVTGFIADDIVVTGGTKGTFSGSAAVYTLDITPIAGVEGNVTVSVASGVAMGSSGSQNSVAIATPQAVDMKAPTATIVLSDTAIKVGESSTVTIIFSEAPVGFSEQDLSVANGTLSGGAFDVSGKIYTATFTPTVNIESTTNLITLASTYTDVAENTGAVATSLNYTVDVKEPILTITNDETSNTANIAGGDITYTFTFSEAVSGFIASDITVVNGTAKTFTKVSDSVYTLGVTPQAGATGDMSVTVAASAYSDVAGNTNTVTTQSIQVIDMQAPTATITMGDNALKAGDTSTVTIAFSEVVKDFTSADITAPTGTLGAFTTADNKTWVATFTPTVNMDNTSNAITLADTYTDSNLNVGTITVSNYTVDTKAPTATITISDSALKAGDTSTVTITFSEAVTNFANADVVAPNGTLTAFTSNDNITWTATFTPTTNIENTANVVTLANTYTDVAGNGGTTTTSSNYAVDTNTPTATITMSDSALKAGDTSLVTVKFSEAVAGFDKNDVTVQNGTVGAFTSSDNITWTAAFAPDSNIDNTTNTITLAATYTDGAGNTGLTASSANYAVDTKAPSVLTLNFLTANDTGLSNTDKITSTPIMNISGTELGATWQYSLNGGSIWTDGSGSTFNLSDNTSYAIGTIQIRQTDAAGNVSNATSNTEVITADTAGPKLTITDDEPMVTTNMDGSNTDGTTDANGADVLYTFKFDEVVKDFSVNDIVVTMQKTDGTVDYTYTAASDPSGSIFKTFTASPDGMTYTLSVTPKVGYEGNMAVSVLPSLYHDVAGNIGTVASAASVQAVDMLAPVLNDTVYDGTSDWTYDIANRKIIFTLDSQLQAVSMATPDNFVVELNTKPVAVKAVEMLGNQVTLIMSEDFTATESVRVTYKDATGNMSAAIQDLAGNDATSFTYLKPDVTPPTVLDIHFNNSGLSIGQSTLVTITFSEEVSDVLVSFQNGTLSALAPSANAAIWTATFTASADVEDLSSVFTTVSYHDLNKLANTSPTPYTYAVDTHSPGVSISDDEFGVGNIAGGTITYTFTFTEAVRGFTVGDVTVAGGQKATSFASGVDGDSVYTLIVTPNVGFEGNVTVDVAGGKVFDTFSNPNIAADQSIQAVDMLALAKPTITLKTDSGFDTADGITNVNGITVTADASVARWEYSLNGGTSWTTGSGTNFNIATNHAYVTGDIQVHQIDTAGNTSAVESNTDTIIIDKTAPRIATTTPITVDGTTGTITITMDSVLNPNDIAKENFLVNINGTTQTISAASIDGSNVLLYVPSFASSASVKISYADVSAGDAFPSLKDLAGNNAVSFTKIVNDTAGAPTAMIILSDVALKIGDTATVTIAFSEAVQNFSNADVTVEGGTLGTLITSDNITWTATFTPTADLESTVNVITLADTYTDTTGVTGTTATSLNYTIDTHAPTVTITNDQLSPTANIAGGTITYTFTFDEIVTGFTASDITVVGGVKGALSGSGMTYTLDITPTAGFEGNITVDIAGAKAFDAAGNANTVATQSIQAVDMKAPTLAITDDEAATTANIAGGDITYTFTFSENVVGFTADDIAVTNGIKGIFSGSGSSYTLVVSPITGSTAPITIDVPGVNQVDISGNTGTNMTAIQAVDMSAPTATVTMSDSALKIGDTSTVTIAFSEAVVGFSNADVTTLNGTLGTFTTANSGITWTATFTPTANIANTVNSITLADSYTDVNLNTGTAASSDNYTIDTIAPTVTITNDQVGTANIAGGDILYTFTFSEAVTGFTVLDVAVVGGNKAAALVQTSATTYTLLVTPTGTGNLTVNIADGTTTGIADTAGNLSIAAFQSTQAVDILPPTVTSVKLYDSTDTVTTSLTIGQTATVKIVFSEAVTNFDNTDVSLAGAKGTLGTLTSADNITWTGLFTPTASTSDASNIIQVLNTYTDVATNNGTVGVSGNFAIDTRPSPVAAPTFHLTSDTSSGANNTDGITKTNGVTVTLAVGITNWEYSLDGGTTWTTGTTVAGVSSFNLVENTSYAAGQIEVRQTDTDGNISTIASNTQTTIVDTIAAIPIISAVATNDVVDASENANLVISGTGEAGATVTLAVTNQTAIVDASGTWNIVVLDPATSFAQGSETLSVTQTDVAGNVSLAGTRDIFIDTIRPILDSLIDVKANIGSDSIALTFNENLAPVDFASADSFIVEINGIVYDSDSAIKSRDLISAVATTDKIVTLIFDTNIHNINFGDTIRVGYIGATGGSTTAIQDLIGNDAPSFGYVTATVENTDTPPVLTNMIANGSSLSLTFNEALNASTTNLPAITDFTVKVNGVVDAVSAVSITGSNVALTLATAYANNDLVEVTYRDNISTTNAIQDLIGNDALSFTYTSTADTVSPKATITMSDYALTVGETSTVTIAFDEAVKNFSLADLTAPNGTLGALTTTDNITWTTTFTPTTNVTATVQTIDLAATYNDIVGNAGTVKSSANYTIDTQAPHLLGSSANVTTHEVTFNFDKALDPVNFAPISMFTATDGITKDPNDATKYVNYTISNVAILNDTTGGHATVTIDPSILSTANTIWTLVYNDAPGNDTQALQDIYGSDVSSFTQALKIGTPSLTTMIASDSADTIVMTFSENLDTANLPALSDLLINVNTVDIAGAIASITASGTDLTLHMNAGQFVSSDTVKVTYSDPTANNDILAIQDLNGNDALSFTNTVNAVL
ncbi:MAG: Ig-like domain-containing protein [Campylobacterales bacterium]|nr:Ig-like domain-containing protein [Campylobacterales bacterium]